MRLMQWLIVMWMSVAAGMAALPGHATQASLLLSAESAQPGTTVLAGVRLQMDPGWHTYWRNGGDSGAPTTIQWTLPKGIQAGEIEWPVPNKDTTEGLTTYIYHDEVVLLVPLTIATNAPLGGQEITAKVSWLECQLNCVPGQATLHARLNIGDQTKPSDAAAMLESWQQKMPQPEPRLQAHAWWEKPASGDRRPLLMEWTRLTPETEGDFFPYANDKFDVGAKTETVSAPAGKIRLRKVVQKYEGDWPKTVAGLIVERAGQVSKKGYPVNLSISASVATEAAVAPTRSMNPPAPASPPVAAPQKSLWQMLLLAFVGGLILNIMPCVLPVIALKVLGFVKQSREEPRQVRKLGLVYGLGVLASFLVLAGVVIAVQQAGHRASWGMQFGNPQFLVILIILVTLVALNLFGVFEVTLGGRTLGAAAELAGREGYAGAFFNGVLATALATPCTAPFLSVALGFAFLQPPAIIVLMFLAVGLGLAFPYVVLTWQPAWLKFLPKPGAWMEKFKIAMGFPLLATAVWLFTIAERHYGKHVWWLGLFLVIVAMAAWIYGEFVQRGRARKGLAVVVMLMLLAVGYGYAMEDQLRWRSPQEEVSSVASLQESPEGIPWRPWSRQAVAQARADGHPVFVDFTADWCVTCQANKKTSIEIPSVRRKLQDIHAVSLLGDYTLVPDRITVELSRFGRAGVPLGTRVSSEHKPIADSAAGTAHARNRARGVEEGGGLSIAGKQAALIWSKRVPIPPGQWPHGTGW